jgi:NitT/TauT family transport system permease protein
VLIWSGGYHEFKHKSAPQTRFHRTAAFPSTHDVFVLTLERLVDHRNSVQRYSIAILSHLLLVVAWHFFVVLGNVPKFVMPSPTATLQALLVPNYRWMENITVTSIEIFGGYLLAVVGGVGIALMFSWFRTLEMIVMPLLVSLNMIPKVALGPLILVWFSYGIVPNIAMAFAICFFPIVLTTARGLREVEPDLLDLVRSIKGSRWQLFTKIQLPGALPYIFSGMKVAAILAVAGAIVGEFLGSDRGLGYLMLQVQVTLDTAAMFMAVILITLIGMVLYGLVLGLERLLVVRDARI